MAVAGVPRRWRAGSTGRLHGPAGVPCGCLAGIRRAGV